MDIDINVDGALRFYSGRLNGLNNKVSC
jgi:hypothetical protein